MDNYLFISRLCLTALLAFGCIAQEDEMMEVKFDTPGPIYTQAGAENIELRCILNQDPLFVTQNRLEIIHQNPVTKKERIMALGGLLEEGGTPAFYNVKSHQAESQRDVFNVIFTIKLVRDVDDGPFICKATESKTKKESTSTVDLVVVRDIKLVMLRFDGSDPVSTKPEDPIEVDAGTYEVKCMAVGANPPAQDVKLYLDGVLVEADGEVSVTPGENTNLRTFVSTITAQVDIDVQSSGKDLQCVANGTSNNVVTSELGIKVNTYDSHVICNDSSAHEGQMSPILTCIVNYTGIAIDSFAFQIGKTGEIIEDGGTNADNVRVNSKLVYPSVSEVSLNLHKAQNWHFEEDFYIIIRSKGGHVTKERVVLTKLERKTTPRTVGDGDDGDGDGDSASVLDGQVALVVLSVLMGLLLQLF